MSAERKMTERKCSNCIHFQYGEVPKSVYDSVIYNKPNGACMKMFPRGYLGRKPPHYCHDNKMACFQFEPRKQMTIFEIGRGQ